MFGLSGFMMAESLVNLDTPQELKVIDTDAETYLYESDGTVIYHKKGTDLCHRVDGPAVINADGSVKWFLFGVEVTEDEHKRIIEYRQTHKSVWESYQNRSYHKTEELAFENEGALGSVIKHVSVLDNDVAHILGGTYILNKTY